MNLMQKIWHWIKNNKLATVLLIVVLYFVFGRTILSLFGGIGLLSSRSSISSGGAGGGNLGAISEPLGLSAPLAKSGVSSSNLYYPAQEVAPVTDVSERLVVSESNISLVVKDVRKTSDEIISFVEGKGGYMVSTTLTQPIEAPFATVVVRIPSDKFREALDNFRNLAIKVSSEYISGKDVTDEYEDLEARLSTLEKTKARFETIMDQAVKIEDILRVQQEIINLQNQIDRLRGRQFYLEQTAKLSRITVYLSTDELALPYAPSETFRPNVILKLAIRSLILNLRKIATAFIWIAVYSAIWVPIILIIILIKRWKGKRARQIPQQK